MDSWNLKRMLKNLDTSSTTPSTFADPLGSLCKDILNDIENITIIDEKEPIPCPVKFSADRWTVCETFLTSEAEKSDLSDKQNIEKLRDAIKRKLRGISITAKKAQEKSEQFQGSVLVEHGTVVAIYGTPDKWFGHILCKTRGFVFSSHHFQNDLPLPLRCDDKVSFLMSKNGRCTILPGSVRLVKYCNEIGTEAVGLVDLFLETSCEELLRNKQASALFTKLLSEEDALRNEKFIEGVLLVAVDFIVLRFPIGSEEERETNELFTPFGLNRSAYVNPVDQKRFLSFFEGSAYPKHLLEFCNRMANEHERAEVGDILVKAIFLLFALIKEFPKEAEFSHLVSHVQSVITKVLAPFLDNHKLGLRLMSLIWSVVFSPPMVESWRNIPALLTVEEFHRRVREGMPRVPEVKATYRDVEEYFDTYYKLLREDAYRGLCRSVEHYLELKGAKLDQKTDAVYKIQFVEVVPYRMGQFNLCRVEWKAVTDAVKQEGGENSLYLHESNLFCISASGKFKPEKVGDALFAVKVSEHSSEGHRKGILLKFLSTECNGISEVEAIEKLARHADNAVMVESPVFYRAYEPVLTALKAMDTQQFPFKSEVLNLKACCLDDEYLPEEMVDISPFQSADMMSAKLCHVSDICEELNANSVLDETQVQAVNLVLSQRLAIIQGPPGTGKTFLTARIIQSLLNVQKHKRPIVVMAYKNRVLDQLVSMCAKFCGGNIVRLGHLSEDYQQKKTLQDCLMSQKLPPKGNMASSMHCLRKSVANFWKDWKDAHTLRPQQITLTACLELFKRKVVQIFFEFSVPDINVQELMQNLDDPLDSQADRIFEVQKEEWLRSLRHGSAQSQEDTMEASEIVEAEDEHKERDRMCDTKDDIFISASDDEEGKGISFGKAPRDYLEVNDKMRKQVNEGTSGDSAQYLHSFFSCLADKLREQAIARLKDTLSRIEDVTQEAQGDYLNKELKLLKDTKVVAMTITKACIEHKLLHLLQPEMIVIEEAGGILEANVIACITPNTKHLIMVGDYKQIGPKVASQELKDKKHNLKNFSASLMERLVDPNSVETGRAMPRFPFVCLDTQSRMNPALLPLFKQDYGMSLRTREEILPLVTHPQCMQSSFFWWSYPAKDKSTYETRKNGKIWNKLEAKMAASYCYWLYSEGFNPKDIAILSPYREQVIRIRTELKNCDLKLDSFAEGSVFTVDEFQGHERDLVILSLVRNNENRNVGFLMDKTRQVVAVSRQKRALCIIGCHGHFMACSPSWKERVETFSANEHLLIQGEKVQRPCRLQQLVCKRLTDPGRIKQPLYDAKLPEVKCHMKVKIQGSNLDPSDALMPIEGKRSAGNLHVHVQNAVGNVQVSITQNQPEEKEQSSKQSLLDMWKGQKLVIGSDWDRLKSSLCLITCKNGIGTGFIGKKSEGNTYLVTCWHIFEKNVCEEEEEGDQYILKVAKQCTVQFSYTEVMQEKWKLEGSDLLQDKNPVGNEELDLVALQVNEEALKGLPGQIHPVDLSAMRYVKTIQDQLQRSWKDYFITIVGFPGARPMAVSIGKIKKEAKDKLLLYHNADTEKGSSGSPVIVAEKLQRPGECPTNGLAVIAVHTEEDMTSKQRNVATPLALLVDMLE